jgi:single-strand DNA-binding protein
MSSLNRVVLIGRLTKDPDLRYTSVNGVAVATFTLAVNRKFAGQGKQREADFIPIVVWKAAAENCAKYLGKGSLVAVEGRLQIRSYEDRDQQRRTIAEVVAENVQFLDSRNKQERDPQQQPCFDDGYYDDDVPF